jgi:hypothetical protein
MLIYNIIKQLLIHSRVLLNFLKSLERIILILKYLILLRD